MLAGSQMIAEAVRRVSAGEDTEAVLRDIFGEVLDAAAYAARKSRRLDDGEGDASDLIFACEACAEAIADDEE